MFPLDYLVAAALLAGPPGSDSAGAAQLYDGIVPLVRQLALNWEILDPKEAKYVLTVPDNFKSDMNLLRQRFRELHDAPPLHDCLRFPPKEVVSDLLSFNRRYRDHLNECRAAGTSPGERYDDALLEAEYLYKVWDAIRDSRVEYYFITVRRQALKKVRDMIGETAFYNGDYPPHVPLWRFRHID